MFGWSVKKRIKADVGEYSLEVVAPILQNPDLTFDNLEAPLTTESKKAVWNYTKILVDPVTTERLPHAGFNVLSLANDHMELLVKSIMHRVSLRSLNRE